MAKKTLFTNPSKKINNILADKFKFIKNRFRLNLDSVFNKSFSRAFDFGVVMGGNKQNTAKKAVIKNKINALRDVMIKDIDNIENQTTQDISRDVASSYAKGTGTGQIKKDIADKMGNVQYKIDRSVRTNTAYLASLTKLLTWQEAGFTHYKWVTGRFDNKTRPKHKELHMKEFAIADALAGRAPVPGHWMENGKINLGQSINCRCGVRLSR